MPEENIKQTTLCYLERNKKVLMLHRTKKENDPNHDKWIAVGGKFEAGESPEECMLREVFEETGLTVNKYRYGGVVTFVSDEWPQEMMHLFIASRVSGTLKECPEGELRWIELSRVLDYPMWEGDKIFFRLLHEDIPFFSLKLRYEGEALKEIRLNGKPYEEK